MLSQRTSILSTRNFSRACSLKSKLAVIFTAFVLGTGCVSLPDVYIIDHHTVMEEEASGEWPQLEQRFHDLAVSPGPVDLAKETNDSRRKRAFSVLNGAMTTTVDTTSRSR